MLTVSNYGTYQRVALPERDNISRNYGRTAGQQWDQLEHIEAFKEEDAASASSNPEGEKGTRGKVYTPEFEDFWSASGPSKLERALTVGRG